MTDPSRLLPAPRIQNPWIGPIKSYVTQKETIMYRYWGGRSARIGAWVSPRYYPSIYARTGLALPPGNTAEFVSEVTVPAGTRVQSGTAAPAFGERGGFPQVFLLDRIPSGNFSLGAPTI
jgi:hypothetical protein